MDYCNLFIFSSYSLSLSNLLVNLQVIFIGIFFNFIIIIISIFIILKSTSYNSIASVNQQIMLTAHIICLSGSMLFHVNNILSRDIPSCLIILKVHSTQFSLLIWETIRMHKIRQRIWTKVISKWKTITNQLLGAGSFTTSIFNQRRTNFRPTKRPTNDMTML